MLVFGNHDVHARGELAAPGFDQQDAAVVCDTDPVLVLTHSPLRRVPPNAVNVHGHLHGPPGLTSRHLNVSVERTGYRPVPLTEVLSDAAGVRTSGAGTRANCYDRADPDL